MAQMSRSHFVFLAGVLLETKPIVKNEDDVTGEAHRAQWSEMVEVLAVRLRETNPQFNAERFRIAAGL